MKYTLIFIALATLITSCKKEPGIGGDAEIRGQVWFYEPNGNGEGAGINAYYPAEDTYVYIVYGDNTGFDKRVKTDYNGNYRFPYLYPGDYTLYVYSLDTSADSFDSQRPIIKKVTIQKRKEIIELDRFDIIPLQ
jgi:hypothetical protein